jgi:uncharacterized protein with ACT and thioredoxin-like domain
LPPFALSAVTEVADTVVTTLWNATVLAVLALVWLVVLAG